MAIGPSINTSLRAVNFPTCAQASLILYTEAPLAPWTGSTVGPTSGTYQYGQLLAQYTSGANKGYFVNYDPAGANGQEVFVGVLMDDLFTPGATVVGQVQISLVLVNGPYVYSQLQMTAAGNLDTAIAARKAKVIYDFNQGYPTTSQGLPAVPSTLTQLIYGL